MSEPTDRLIDLEGVIQMTTLKKSAIYAGMAKKTFPQCVRVAARRTAWLASEIDAWIASLPRGVARARGRPARASEGRP